MTLHRWPHAYQVSSLLLVDQQILMLQIMNGDGQGVARELPSGGQRPAKEGSSSRSHTMMGKGSRSHTMMGKGADYARKQTQRAFYVAMSKWQKATTHIKITTEDSQNIAEIKFVCDKLLKMLKLLSKHYFIWKNCSTAMSTEYWDLGISKHVTDGMGKWGNDDCPDITVTLGDNVLKIVPSHKHFGVDLASKNDILDEIYNRKIGEAQKIFYTARGLGSHYNPVPTNVLSKLYWSVVIPKMTYGLEVRAISDTRVMEFENVHRKLVKAAQHLLINTPSPATLATLGWTSLESYLDMKKILFLWKIFQFPVSDIYRRIVTKMLQNNLIMGSLWNSELRDSPVIDMFKAVCKHGMENLIRKYAILGELHKLGSNMNKTYGQKDYMGTWE